MTNAELIKALRYCGNFEDREGCDEECPYFNDKDCPKRIMCDAADALEAAEKRIAIVEEERDLERFAAKNYLDKIDELKASNEELRERQTYIDHWGDAWAVSGKDVPTAAYNHGFLDGEQSMKNCGARMQTVTDCHTLEEGKHDEN